MTQGKQDLNPIPPMTVLVAKSAFPKGNVYMTMRDQLGVLYRDSDLATLFSRQYGRPPLSPTQLALITLMQFAEGLSDRQTAEAVRSRIDLMLPNHSSRCQPSVFRLLQSLQFLRLGRY